MAVINVLGLAIGMTAFLLILHYVHFEKSYDRHYPDLERLYRLRYERTTEDGSSVKFASCCPPAGPLIRERYPEVEKIGRIYRYRASVSYEDIKFYEERLYFAEPDFLEVLPFEFSEGDPIQKLKEPNYAFISQSTARRYFGDQNPVGKTISLDKSMNFQVAGIFRDIPANSHLKFDFLLSFQNLEEKFGPEVMEAWGHTGFFTYLKLRPEADPREFGKRLAELVESEFGAVLKEYQMKMELPLQPLGDIHLNSHFMQEYEVNGNRDSVNFLLIIAIFIMIIAWVNYINLSTARASTRSKEVGLRKVVGASRVQLAIQFFLEIIVINLLAMIISLLLIEILKPLFSQITRIPAEIRIWDQGWFWLMVPSLLLIGIILSGLYPVAVMSSFRPQTVLRGKLGEGRHRLILRQVMVIFQFTMSLILLAGTLTINRQIAFMRQQDLGFDQEQIVVVRTPRVRDNNPILKFKGFREILLNSGEIKNVCHVTEVPGRQILWDAGAILRAGEDPSQGKNYQIVGVDYHFAEVFDLKFMAGRNFSEQFSTDQSALLLNETAVKHLGFENAQSAVGQKVDYWGDLYNVIGVLKNYHQQSPKAEFEPHIYRLLPTGRDVRGVFAIKLNSTDIRNTIQLIQKQYEEFFPGNPFEYFFLDQYFDQQYQADELFGKVFLMFSLLALVITSLGIFGLSSFTVTQRTKEIGIRKALGASIKQILLLFIKDILRLILLAFLIVIPLLLFGLREWLSSFARHIPLQADLFILPLLILITITLLTIGYQIIKASLTNPVEVLRYE